MGYLALYREWRPKRFKELIGQDHIRITLTNALKQNKVAHAYLFSGPRGTGKTTTAKILAKALNCKNRIDEEPCNACVSCQEIDQGMELDVLEIDAASNRGIDEIRDLREKVKLAPAGGKYKIYIIDEVHMLTTEAFNALLKTLEEPPASVVFVLATTEPHKVPMTILSRVQRFEFHRISVEGIISRLQEVCSHLGRIADDKALRVIAYKAEGGLRDALSILDQCLLLEDPIEVDKVYQIIGMLGETYSADLTDALLEGDYGSALTKLNEGIAQGREPRQIIKELLDYLRQALLFSAAGQEPIYSAEMKERLIRQSQKAGLEKLLDWINILLKGEGDLKYATNSRLATEMILVQTLYERRERPGQPKQPEQPKQVERPKQAPELPKRVPGVSEQGLELPKKLPGVPEPAGSKGIASREVHPEDLLAKWPEVLEGVKRKKRSTHAFLLEGQPLGLDRNMLYLGFSRGFSFHKDKFTQSENKNVVEEVLEKIFGMNIELISIIKDEYDGLRQKKKTENAAMQDGIPPGEQEAEGEESGCIEKALELFGQELVQVRKVE